MSEILTESFCERCGTRYTFETQTHRTGRFGKIKVLSKGLKNYVLSDESSLDEALADARSDQDRQASGQQLDAFHKTFNFCMSCRQYTCANCWNEAESRCLSCAPHLGYDVLEAPFRTPESLGGIASIGAAATGNGHEPDLETLLKGHPAEAAWPVSDRAATPAHDEALLDESTAEAEADAVTRLESLFAIATQPDEAVRDAGQATAAETSPAPRPLAARPLAARPADEAHLAPPAHAEPLAAAEPPAAAVPPAAAKVPSPAKPARPERDIALEVSLFEEEAVHAGAEAAVTVPEPSAVPTAGSPQTAAEEAGPVVPAGESEELEDRTAAAVSQTADLLARFRTTSGPQPIEAAEPTPVEPAAAPAQPPVAAEPVAAEPARPRVDRIEVPTWHVETPPAPAGQPNGHPPEPAIIPTSPGPALRPSVQARWPATPPEQAPRSPVPPATTPAASILPQAPQPSAQASVPPAPTAEPQWPAAPAWPTSQPSAGGSWPAGQSRVSRVSAVDAIWAASSRDVLNRPETGVQACVNCGLPLSSTARFCRRCGASQLQA